MINYIIKTKFTVETFLPRGSGSRDIGSKKETCSLDLQMTVQLLVFLHLDADPLRDQTMTKMKLWWPRCNHHKIQGVCIINEVGGCRKEVQKKESGECTWHYSLIYMLLILVGFLQHVEQWAPLARCWLFQVAPEPRPNSPCLTVLPVSSTVLYTISC